jgi:hypothetical protein
MTRGIDLLAGTGNAPAAIDGLHSGIADPVLRDVFHRGKYPDCFLRTSGIDFRGLLAGRESCEQREELF